jgi:hypothetical protein
VARVHGQLTCAILIPITLRNRLHVLGDYASITLLYHPWRYHRGSEAPCSAWRVHDALVAAGVPVIGVRRGDPLVHILEQGPQQ